MRSAFADLPLVRECPLDVLARVREIDPRADVLFLPPNGRDGHLWLVGHVRENTLTRGSQETVLASLHRIPRRKRTRAWHRKVLMCRARQRGFRPIVANPRNDADGTLVEHFRFAVHEIQRAGDYLAEFDRQDEAYRAELEADLADSARSRDWFRYMRTQSHSVTRLDDPMKPRAPRAGWQRVASIS